MFEVLATDNVGIAGFANPIFCIINTLMKILLILENFLLDRCCFYSRLVLFIYYFMCIQVCHR